MSQSDKIYKKHFRRHFINHEANFPPSRPIQIGDYGVIAHGNFVRIGHIKDKGLEFDVVNDDDPTYEQFKSNSEVSISATAKGEIGAGGVAAIKAQLEIGFASEESLFFSSAEVRYKQMANVETIGKKLVKMYKKGQWDKKYVLITSIIEGENVVLIITGKSGANVVIEAETDKIEKVDLADVKAKISFKNEKGVSYKIISDGTLQIGYGASKVVNPLFRSPRFNYRGKVLGQFELLDSDKSFDKKGLTFADINLRDYQDEIL